MNTTKILESEIKDLKISSLPSRPTAPTAFGGKGYTSAQMKSAFDRLPLFIIERLNSLIDDACSIGEGSLSASIPTGIIDGHTLGDIFNDIMNGSLAGYLHLGGKTLSEFKAATEDNLRSLNSDVTKCLRHIDDFIIDAGAPWNRESEGEIE